MRRSLFVEIKFKYKESSVGATWNVQLNPIENMCLNGWNKQVAPLELNTLIVFNATNSRLRRSRRKTNKSRLG